MADNIVVNQHSQFSTKHNRQFRAIYVESFPSHERAEFSCLVESIARATRLFFAAMRDDTLLGFAIIIPRIASDFHLLEYLAVAKDARGDGIGGVILSHVMTAMRATGDANGLLLELESDEEGTGDERRLRERRIGFYQRIGARAVECAPYYRVPLADRPGTMRMKLLWLAISVNAQPPHGAKLRECLGGIFEKGYELGADNSLLLSNLDELIC